jgi:hypothetical protein
MPAKAKSTAAPTAAEPVVAAAAPVVAASAPVVAETTAPAKRPLSPTGLGVAKNAAKVARTGSSASLPPVDAKEGAAEPMRKVVEYVGPFLFRLMGLCCAPCFRVVVAVHHLSHHHLPDHQLAATMLSEVDAVVAFASYARSSQSCFVVADCVVSSPPSLMLAKSVALSFAAALAQSLLLMPRMFLLFHMTLLTAGCDDLVVLVTLSSFRRRGRGFSFAPFSAPVLVVVLVLALVAFIVVVLSAFGVTLLLVLISFLAFSLQR